MIQHFTSPLINFESSVQSSRNPPRTRVFLPSVFKNITPFRITAPALSCDPSIRQVMARPKSKPLVVSHGRNSYVYRIGTNDRIWNSNNWTPWQSKTCTVNLAFPRRTPSFSASTGIIPSRPMVRERLAIVVMAPLAQPHNSNWQTPTLVVSNNLACVYSSRYAPTKVSSA